MTVTLTILHDIKTDSYALSEHIYSDVEKVNLVNESVGFVSCRRYNMPCGFTPYFTADGVCAIGYNDKIYPMRCTVRGDNVYPVIDAYYPDGILLHPFGGGEMDVV